MICPKCGSRDIEAQSLPFTHKHHCICGRCHNEWLQVYDPSGTANKKAAGDDKK